MVSFAPSGGPDDVSAVRTTTGRLRRFVPAVAAIATAGACLGAPACTRSAPARRLVAATVFPVFDLIRRVAGDRLDVRLILAPGLDPHDYEPRPKDVAGLADASLIFAVGLGLDPWAQGLARSAGAGEARVFELGPLMDPILAPAGLIRPEPLIDPHFWTDPVRAQRAVDVIVEALSGLDPEGGPFYRERGGALKSSIQAVHADVARQAQTWTRRRLVTFHGSLFYFAARYGLQVVGVVQPVPGTEPTAQHMAALVAELRGPQAAALFTEPQMEAQLAKALAREAGVGVHEVDPLGGGPKAASYEDLMRGIVGAMDEALR
jgi:ABC-type Zn uptake system ZnuABC Zn-binding protein ZnuA